MSTADLTMSMCANCGKSEDLKMCTACNMIKYCNRECQIAHRPQHKVECKKRAKELYDEKLFKQPPPLEECPICCLRLSSEKEKQVYMMCCGNVICDGCSHAPVYDNEGNVLDDICHFCRTPKQISTTYQSIDIR